MPQLVRSNRSCGKKKSSEKTEMGSVVPFYQCMGSVVAVAVLEKL